MDYHTYITEMAKAPMTIYHFSGLSEIANAVVNDALESKWGDFSFTRNKNFLHGEDRYSLGYSWEMGKIDTAIVTDVADLSSGRYRSLTNPKPYNYDWQSERKFTRHLSKDQAKKIYPKTGFWDYFGNEQEEQVSVKRDYKIKYDYTFDRPPYQIKPLVPLIKRIMIDGRSFNYNIMNQKYIDVQYWRPFDRYMKLRQEISKSFGVNYNDLAMVHRVALVEFLINNYGIEVTVLDGFRETPWQSTRWFKPRFDDSEIGTESEAKESYDKKILIEV